eukprot:13728548-Alexandrium_andersonii.AAC.1
MWATRSRSSGSSKSQDTPPGPGASRTPHPVGLRGAAACPPLPWPLVAKRPWPPTPAPRRGSLRQRTGPV